MVTVRVLCPTLVAGVGSHPHPWIGSPESRPGQAGACSSPLPQGRGEEIGATGWWVRFFGRSRGVSWEMVNCRRRRGASA